MIHAQNPPKKPPVRYPAKLRWIKDNLFPTPFNAFLTFFALYLIYISIPPLLEWALWNANFIGSSQDQCSREGACWIYVVEKLNIFIYGFYPPEEYWRPNLVFALAACFIFLVWILRRFNYPHQGKIIAASTVIWTVAAFFLLYGGFGLETIETHQWGGLLLTIVVALVGIVASFPIGIFLALGRRSKMRFIRLLSVIYIEFIRGVPLITILFMASVVLPLFLAEGVDFNKLLRALIGITLFQAAYIAEVVRGGLQAIPKGQYEAADALGLSFYHKMTLIILPQALKVSIPVIIGSFIALFKDTTLVLIIGLFDILAVVGLTTSDGDWLGRETEGYVFVTLVMWVILYAMSHYSRVLEKRYNYGVSNA